MKKIFKSQNVYVDKFAIIEVFFRQILHPKKTDVFVRTRIHFIAMQNFTPTFSRMIFLGDPFSGMNDIIELQCKWCSKI